MTDIPEILPPEIEEGTVAEKMLADGAIIMKLENENMQALALAHPRNEEAILQGALKELDMVPSLAANSYYSIPYKDRGKTVHVVGPSVNTARTLARRWGNCAVKAIITSEDENTVKVAGIFTDLQTNVRFEKPLVVSKWQTRRQGPPVRVAGERLAQAVQAGISKAERNAILAGLPDYLKTSYFNRAREIAGKIAKDNSSKLLDAFLAFGVTRDMIETHIGKSLEKMSEGDLGDLRGIYNSLNDRETTVEEVFTPTETGKPKTAEEVISGGAKVTGGTTKDEGGGSKKEKE